MVGLVMLSCAKINLTEGSMLSKRFASRTKAHPLMIEYWGTVFSLVLRNVTCLSAQSIYDELQRFFLFFLFHVLVFFLFSFINHLSLPYIRLLVSASSKSHAWFEWQKEVRTPFFDSESPTPVVAFFLLLQKQLLQLLVYWVTLCGTAYNVVDLVYWSSKAIDVLYLYFN